MRKLTQRQIYGKLLMSQKEYLKRYRGERALTDDQINRRANIYAVKNTVKHWRAQ